MPDPDMNDVLQLYQRHLGPISGSQRDRLYEVRDQGMSPFVLGCAVLRASQERRRRGRNKRISFNYVAAILEDWLLHGITDEKAFRAYFADRDEGPAKGGERSATAELKRKFSRADFKYVKPKTPPKGAFSFLDD